MRARDEIFNLLKKLLRLPEDPEGPAMSPYEPLFTLRAQDKLAAATVRHWAELARASKQVPPIKIADALSLASQMEQWTPQRMPD